ncbi:DUF262 domain-containing protein [uncultured Xanthomonas sp.]|uniref:DUF262 domain-containing protein n=1 Tax=uncultured Xanthomonas sp. TaxID=152831 RepID=UPI0025E9C791|nr:DUF262 domain-containing protein [uncultured Xanthomonas sp.]
MAVEVLVNELRDARRQVVTDGYDMSFGEIASMYRAGELVIDPNYQRLFRWEESQKTRFIESLLLGIPVPPIFVYQQESGAWELIDGLQRVSTVLQLMGDLKMADGTQYPPLELGGTNLLPALAGMKWSSVDGDEKSFGSTLQLELKRTRIRVEILRKESDQDTKFELFQRLNTGGSKLSEQEVRNSVLVMLSPEFFGWINSLTELPSFKAAVELTENQRNRQDHVEIALRFVAYRRHPYSRGLDVNEYLDVAARELAKLDRSMMDEEAAIFSETFDSLLNSAGADVFKRWDGGRHLGPFLISAFDAIAYGVSKNIGAINQLGHAKDGWLRDKIHGIWSQEVFRSNSGSGVRGTSRLTNLLPFGEQYFAP